MEWKRERERPRKGKTHRERNTHKEKERHSGKSREAAREGQTCRREQSEPSPSAQGPASPASPTLGPRTIDADTGCGQHRHHQPRAGVTPSWAQGRCLVTRTGGAADGKGQAF